MHKLLTVAFMIWCSSPIFGGNLDPVIGNWERAEEDNEETIQFNTDHSIQTNCIDWGDTWEMSGIVLTVRSTEGVLRYSIELSSDGQQLKLSAQGDTIIFNAVDFCEYTER